MIPCQRDLFDLPDDVAYLNCAYMSPLLKHAVAAGAAGIARKAHPWTISPDDFFADSERARGAVRRSCWELAADDIALVPAASYGVAIAAANLPFGEGTAHPDAGRAVPLQRLRLARAGAGTRAARS